MTREEYETKITNIWKNTSSFEEEARLNIDVKTAYIQCLETRIMELETPKACETCKHFSDEYSTCSKSVNMNMAVDIDYLGCGMYEQKEEK